MVSKDSTSSSLACSNGNELSSLQAALNSDLTSEEALESCGVSCESRSAHRARVWSQGEGMKTADIVYVLLTCGALGIGRREGACPFPALTFTFQLTRLSAERRVTWISSIELQLSGVADALDQLLDQVVEIKEEIVELSLA